MREVLRHRELTPIEVCCRIDKFGRMTIEANICRTHGVHINKGQLTREISGACGRTFTQPSVTAAGVLFGLGAGFLYALYSIFAPFGLRHYTPFTVVYWTFVFGGLGSLFLLDAGEMRTVFADGRMILVALGLIVISTVLPYLLYTNGLARVESGKASILASLEPVVASFVGILAFGEPVSLMVFLGLGCILACVYVLR